MLFLKRCVVFMICFTVFMVNTAGNNSAKEKYDGRELILPEGFCITAHAGAMGTIDNSPSSVKKLVESGADIVEMDISFRPDGTPVMIHDESPGKLQGYSLKKGLEHVASSEACQINLDLKAHWNLPELERLIDEYSLRGRVFYTGVNESQVEQVKNSSTIPFYLNASAAPELRNNPEHAAELAEKVIALGAIGLNCSHGDISEAVVRAMHEKGLLVSIYTVDKYDDLYRVLFLGVDNITTKKPKRLLGIIDEYTIDT